MATQTGSFDFKSAKEANSDARKHATNYLSADSSGIMIYDGTEGVQTPSAPTSTTKNVFIDSDSVDIREGTTVLATFGSTVRIGVEDGGHIDIQPELFDMWNAQGDNTLEIGIASESLTHERYILSSYVLSNSSVLITLPTIASGTAVYIDYSVNGSISREQITIGEASSASGTYAYSYDGAKALSISTSDSAEIYVSVHYSATGYPPALTFGSRTTDSKGAYSTALGRANIASGSYAVAEGNMSVAKGTASHAEGGNSSAFGNYSHAEGCMSVARKAYTHAEGYRTEAAEVYSHAEGFITKATGYHSHAQGCGTTAQGRSQTAIGEYNILQGTSSGSRVNTDHAFIIGNGTSESSRSNALAVTWDGDIEIQVTSSEALGAAITALGWSDIL